MRKYVALTMSLSLAGMPSVGFSQEVKRVTDNKIITSKVDDSEYDEDNQPAAKPSGFRFTSSVASVASPDATAMDPNSEDYPYTALRTVYLEHAKAQKQAEDIEAKNLAERENYERLKVESQAKITDYKRKIEDLKTQSMQAISDMEMMEREVVELKGQQETVNTALVEVEARANLEFKAKNKMREELVASKDRLSSVITKLEVARRTTAESVNQAQIDMEKMRAQIMMNESFVSRTKNDIVRAQTEEVNVLSDLAQMNERHQAAAAEKVRIAAELIDIKKQVSRVKAEYAEIKAETEKTDAELRRAQAKLSAEKKDAFAEIAKLETQTVAARSQQARNESEKARIEAEMGRLQEEVASVKLRHEKAIAQMNESSALVMESRLSYEKNKSDLAFEIAQENKARYDHDSRQMKIRSLASTLDKSGIDGELSAGTAGSKCKVYREPASDSEVVRYLSPGQKVYTAPAAGEWFKVLGPTGKIQYVEKNCVK